MVFIQYVKNYHLEVYAIEYEDRGLLLSDLFQIFFLRKEAIEIVQWYSEGVEFYNAFFFHNGRVDLLFICI